MPKRIDEKIHKATRYQRRTLIGALSLLGMFPVVTLCYLLFKN